MELSVEKWKSVTIGTFFNTYTGGDLIISRVQEGNIPVVSHSVDNNGVKIYSDIIPGRKLFNCRKTISLADRGTFFAAVQKEDFYIGTRVKALEFKDGEHSENVLKFIVTIINNERFRFSYGRNCTSGLDDLVIKLPLKLDGSIDYDFMERYISSLDVNKQQIPDYFLDEGYNKACWYLDTIDQEAFEKEFAGKVCDDTIILDTKDWVEFHLYDIFDIDSGNKFDRSKMSMGAPSVNFIGRSSENNGITAYVDEIEGVEPYKKGYLTVALGGEYLGSCFVQDYPFYTSQNVNVLIPKEEIDIYAKMFIAHLVRFESANNYKAFARELNAHIKNGFVIKLPVTDVGMPDYNFMSNYIKSLSFSKKLI